MKDREWFILYPTMLGGNGLALYLRLGKVHGERLYAVAPDRVADQSETLRLIERYRPELRAIARTGAHVLVPVQRGELSSQQFYAEAMAAAGMALVPALPMNKAAMSHVEVLAFVAAVQPRRLHLLGMGYERKAARSLVRVLLHLHEDLSISLDSNRLRAVTGERRRLTLAERAFQAKQIGSLHAEVEHEALAEAGERMDYTDLIAFPSCWADDRMLSSMAAEAFDAVSRQKAFLSDPDGYLQQTWGDGRVWESPLVADALERAWTQWVTARVRGAVRTAAVREVFSNCRIAMPYKEFHAAHDHQGTATCHPSQIPSER